MEVDDAAEEEEYESELEAIVEQPGTYFNPRTEVTLIIDDSGSLDQTDPPEPPDGSSWIMVSDEPALDEQLRDELIEQFQREAWDTGQVDGITLELDDEYGPDRDDDPDGMPPPAAA